MNWAQFKSVFAHNWREKLIAVLLAFLFWFMIKSQTSPQPLPPHLQVPLPPMRAT